MENEKKRQGKYRKRARSEAKLQLGGMTAGKDT